MQSSIAQQAFRSPEDLFRKYARGGCVQPSRLRQFSLYMLDFVLGICVVMRALLYIFTGNDATNATESGAKR
ncbi:hypothetical protein [Candidatus Vallotia cooleyia]|uniref:hypothetical protein n=1 Tax=Candidatus Vallotiella adelgis TaxID=1177211 RepID=UPI001D00A982|nr:hypothetical protein [Candidatus Vallotia cooleyia]